MILTLISNSATTDGAKQNCNANCGGAVWDQAVDDFVDPCNYDEIDHHEDHHEDHYDDHHYDHHDDHHDDDHEGSDSWSKLYPDEVVFLFSILQNN